MTVIERRGAKYTRDLPKNVKCNVVFPDNDNDDYYYDNDDDDGGDPAR